MSTQVQRVSNGTVETQIINDADLALWQAVGWFLASSGVPTYDPLAAVKAAVGTAIADPSSAAYQEISQFISAAVTNLVNGAPSTLNTLQELATAIANDPTFGADTLAQINALSTQLAGKYSKPVPGIPASDLATPVQNALTAAGTAVQPAALANYAPVGEPVGTSALSVANNALSTWQPNTAYTSGQRVVNPSGDVMVANSAFTSGASYNAANWTLSPTLAKAATAVQPAALANYAPVSGTGSPIATSVAMAIALRRN